MCSHTIFFAKNCYELFWLIKKSMLSLHRYPENYLFTLKKLIPIEDMKRSPVKAVALFFYIFLKRATHQSRLSRYFIGVTFQISDKYLIFVVWKTKV